MLHVMPLAKHNSHSDVFPGIEILLIPSSATRKEIHCWYYKTPQEMGLNATE